jgi:hypothetical protein
VIAFALFANGYLFANRFGDAILVVALVLVVAAATGQIFGSGSARPRMWSPTAPPPASPTWSPTEAPTAAQTEPTWSAAGSGATWQPAPARRRTRSWLGLLTVGATMLTAGVLGIIAATGAAHPQPADVLAACVGVVGLGLLVGAFVGRSWLMIPLGLLLVASLAVADALPRNLTWTAGDRTWAPVGTTVARSYTVGAGDATLDLTNLTPGQQLTIASSTGAGELLVVVPRGSAVALTAHVGAGQIDAFGHHSSGPGVMQQVNVAGSATPPLTLTLNLHVGFGEVVVRDGAA